MPSKYNYHKSALKYLCVHSATLERLKDSPADDDDRTLIDANLKMSPPIEMQNDEKERHRYASQFSIMMAWTYAPASEPKERDRLTMEGVDYRVRKVKKWPQTANPAYYELHLEDES
jgi:hypothetical protein